MTEDHVVLVLDACMLYVLHVNQILPLVLVLLPDPIQSQNGSSHLKHLMEQHGQSSIKLMGPTG